MNDELVEVRVLIPASLRDRIVASCKAPEFARTAGEYLTRQAKESLDTVEEFEDFVKRANQP